jgi:hypothetical protein
MEYDGARPNLFECELTFPFLSRVDGDPQRKFTFMCRAAQLPGTAINSVPMMYFGRELKFAGNRTFPEWTVTIINDEDFVIRKAFERWLNGINSHVENIRDPQFVNGQGFGGGAGGAGTISGAGYQQDAYVTQFAKTGESIKGYKFVGLFPIDVSPIDVDWGSNDNIEEYAVTFAYQWWESNDDNPTTDISG